MKKLIFALLVSCLPLWVFATSIKREDKQWDDKTRSVVRDLPYLYIDVEGNVFLRYIKGEMLEIRVLESWGNDISDRHALSDEAIFVMSNDEIPQEGCYVRISQGDKYILYFVTRD